MNRLLICFLCCVCLSCTTVLAQSVFDLQFTNPVVDDETNQFCTTVQIKGQEGEDPFGLGSHTLFFSYNQNCINNPSYLSEEFDSLTYCVFDLASPYFAPAFFADITTGEANITTLMAIAEYGCPEVNNDWISFGDICFEIVGSGMSTNLQFNEGLTVINLNNNFPSHIQGNLIGLDFTVGEPVSIDTDMDGIPDEIELEIGTQIDNDDSDMDGLSDGLEYNELGTDPLATDTDVDGLMDGQEIEEGTNPLVGDTDMDGISDGFEVLSFETDPLNSDSDFDELSDGDEVNIYMTDPNSSDSDSDGLDDAQEIAIDGDPNNPDFDGDGVLDGIEFNLGDTDLDFLDNIFDNDDDDDGVLTIDEDANGDGDPTNDDWNDDGIPDYLDGEITGLNEIEGAIKAQIYPNPANDVLFIDFGELSSFKTGRVLTIEGKELQSFSINGIGSKQLNISEMNSGLYFIELFDEQSSDSFFYKFIKE